MIECVLIGRMIYGEPIEISQMFATDDFFFDSKENYNAYMFNKLKMDVFRKKNPFFVKIEKDIYNGNIIFVKNED